MADWILERDAAAVMAAFGEVGAAVAPVYDVSEVMADTQFKALNSIVNVADEELGSVRMQNLLFRMSDTPGAVRHAGHRIGQDTDDILRSVLDMSAAEIESLHHEKVIDPRGD